MCLHAPISAIATYRAPDHRTRFETYGREDPSHPRCPSPKECLATQIFPGTGKLLRQISATSIQSPLSPLQPAAEAYDMDLGSMPETSLQKAKAQLTSDCLLVHYDPDRELVLACDAGGSSPLAQDGGRAGETRAMNVHRKCVKPVLRCMNKHMKHRNFTRMRRNHQNSRASYFFLAKKPQSEQLGDKT